MWRHSWQSPKLLTFASVCLLINVFLILFSLLLSFKNIFCWFGSSSLSFFELYSSPLGSNYPGYFFPTLPFLCSRLRVISNNSKRPKLDATVLLTWKQKARTFVSIRKKMNKVQDISTPLSTVVGRDFMHDDNPIGADQVSISHTWRQFQKAGPFYSQKIIFPVYKTVQFCRIFRNILVLLTSDLR